MRHAVHRILLVILIILTTTIGHAPVTAALVRDDVPTADYLTLAVTPARAPVGSVVTLVITYHGLGMPHTTITVTPPDALSFDPPQAMPCAYDHDPTSCEVITFRTHIPGDVTIAASADGEIFDTVCGCWRWDGADAATVLTITGSRVFLPVVQH